MVKEAEGATPRSSASHLLSLPPELILEIIAYLPLAAHLIFRLQVCRALRTNSHDAHASHSSSSRGLKFNARLEDAESSRRTSSLNLGPLKLTPPHRFSLSQWLAARQELQRLRLARPDEDEDDEESHGEHVEGGVDEVSSSPVVALPDQDAHRAGLTLQPAAFDWHKSAAAPSTASVSLSRPVAPRPHPQLAPRMHKVGVRERRDAGPAHEARMLRRILGFLTLISPAEALAPEWTLPPWEAGRADEARRQKLDDMPRLSGGMAPWSGTGLGEKEHPTPRREASQTALVSNGASQSVAGSLRTLSLIGWSGISGEEVVSLLRTCPALSDVKVVLKTDRLDNGPWEHLRSPATGALQGAAPSPQERVVRPPPPVPNEVPAAEETGRETTLERPTSPSRSSTPPAYIETQVVVNVGSRVPPEAHVQIKGQGLSAGYRALCYSASSTSSSSSNAPEVASSAEPTAAALAGAASGGGPALHVIFQGRFRLPDALEIEEMLSWSEVRCSACRAVLLF